MDPLAKLFGSAARVKLLRLFLFNENDGFTVADAANRSKVAKDAARKEVNVLLAADIIRKKQGKGTARYTVNQKFEHYEALRTFLLTTSGLYDTHSASSFRRAGTIRLLVLSGLFTGVVESKVDILIVGDRIDEKTLGVIVRGLEAELGRELRYASFTTEDFRYRVGVYDRLVRDILDYPHRLVLDKIGI